MVTAGSGQKTRNVGPASLARSLLSYTVSPLVKPLTSARYVCVFCEMLHIGMHTQHGDCSPTPPSRLAPPQFSTAQTSRYLAEFLYVDPKNINRVAVVPQYNYGHNSGIAHMLARLSCVHPSVSLPVPSS